MLGPFATASRRTPHCHSPGVATVALHAACASMSTTTTTTRDRGDRYGPIEWAQLGYQKKTARNVWRPSNSSNSFHVLFFFIGVRADPSCFGPRLLPSSGRRSCERMAVCLWRGLCINVEVALAGDVGIGNLGDAGQFLFVSWRRVHLGVVRRIAEVNVAAVVRHRPLQFSFTNQWHINRRGIGRLF